jgi:hypothetical protein
VGHSTDCISEDFHGIDGCRCYGIKIKPQFIGNDSSLIVSTYGIKITTEGQSHSTRINRGDNIQPQFVGND